MFDPKTDSVLLRKPTRHNNKGASTSWSESPSFKFDSEWVPATSIASEPATCPVLTIVSQNVLFDDFQPEKIHSEYRWTELINQVEHMNADFIGFQEVKEPFLQKLLATPWIRSSYYISTIGGPHVEPYGQVLIAKYPFQVSFFEYSSQKRVIIGTFQLNNRTLHIPVIHLTSDHGKGDLGAKRIAQMGTIYERTVPDITKGIEADNGADVFIIGDYNMTDGGEGEALSLRPDLVDCWKQLNGLSDPGYTFDPDTNVLAAINTKTGLRRRYDRILVRSAGFHWQPLSCQVVNTEPVPFQIGDGSTVTLPVSDHFGIMAQIQFLEDVQERASLISARAKLIASNTVDSSTMDNIIESEHLMETKSELSLRAEALRALEQLISACLDTKEFRLFPVGSYGLGLQTPSSDIDVLCAGSISPADFFPVLLRFLRREARQNEGRIITGAPALVLDAIVPLLTFGIMGVTIDIQYAQVRNVKFNKSLDLGRMLADAETRPEVRNQFDQASLLAAQSVRALTILTSLIPDLPVFRKAYVIIKRWAEARGLTSNRMCFLGGHAWTIMLTRVAQTCSRTSVYELVAAFFATYAVWDFRTHPVTVQTYPEVTYRHVARKEPICIVTCSAPFKNITRNATQCSRQIFVAELQRAHSLFSLSGGAKSPAEVLRELWTPSNFFGEYSKYLQVNVAAATHREYSSFSGQVESRLVSLITRLESYPAIVVRPWPVRYIHRSSSFGYSCSFYLGLTLKDSMSQEDARTSNHHLDEFIKMMENWAGFDVETMRISMQSRPRDYFNNVTPLPETSTTYSIEAILEEYPEDSPADSDEEEEEEEIDASAEPSSSAPSSSTPSSSAPSSSADKATKAKPAWAQGKKGATSSKPSKRSAEPEAAQNNNGGRRMKTSEECINWIRHDSRFNSEEFIISYEDRFVGLMEVPVSKFTSDTSSDVFIPQHRIWLIKQNGRIVWDRKNRMDILGDEFRQ